MARLVLEHIHKEEYPEPIRTSLEALEDRITFLIQLRFKNITPKLIAYAQWRIEAKKSVRDVKSKFKLSDFVLPAAVIALLYEAMQIGMGYQRDQILTQIRQVGLDPVTLEQQYGIDFNIPNIESRPFVSVMDQRVDFLSNSLSETTYQRTSDIIDAGIKNGSSMDDIAARLTDEVGFTGDRAMLIARTETARAVSESQRLYLKSIGAQQYAIRTAEDACDDCIAAAEQVYDIDDVDILPIHPNCRCTPISVKPDYIAAAENTEKSLKLSRQLLMLQKSIERLKPQKGEKGDPGMPGMQGEKGADGYTPQRGVDYFDGINGENGVNGINGMDGKDGENAKLDKSEIERLIRKATPVKGRDYLTKADMRRIAAELREKMVKSSAGISKEDVTHMISTALNKLQILTPNPAWGQIVGDITKQADLISYIATHAGGKTKVGATIVRNLDKSIAAVDYDDGTDTIINRVDGKVSSVDSKGITTTLERDADANISGWTISTP